MATIIPISSMSAQSAQSAHSFAGVGRGGMTPEGVSISFGGDAAAKTPLSQVGEAVFDKLSGLERARADKRAHASANGYGPASPYDHAVASLRPGPAHIPPGGMTTAAPPAKGMTADQATDAMMRSFDYAIETQLIVKTGSQFSTSLSSLLCGQ